MAYLVIFASCVALVIQNVALAHVPPAQASLFLRLESVFGVLFSVLLYGEQVGLKLIVGFVLIFGAILVSEMFPPETQGRCNQSTGSGAGRAAMIQLLPMCAVREEPHGRKDNIVLIGMPAPANLPSASCWRRS